ncbi:MAG: hypothetical protein ACT4N4_14910, partial [Rhodospirillales bacterium]
SARACRLMAEIEKAEHADAAAAERWRARADDAPPDPAWVCDKCGALAQGWAALCPSCGGFGALAWRAPRRVAALQAAAAAAAPAIVAPPVEGGVAIPAAANAEARPDFGKTG